MYAQDVSAFPAGPAQLSQSRECAATPKRFVTRHTITLSHKPLRYTAIAGEIQLHNLADDPIGSIFSFTYIKDGLRDASSRPVMFVFNGGPGSSSIWLHMGIVGPRRLALDREVNPRATPPFHVVDNPDTLLDVADLVFIDPVGTGWSRAICKGSAAEFWGVDQDAEAVSQFIERWLTAHGRWDSPKFVMGESYGSIRAAILPRALMGGAMYGGVMRGITLNGIVLLGTTLEAREPTGRPRAELTDALYLPAAADAAWYHDRIDRRGRDLETFHQEALSFALGQYAEALRQEKAGILSPEAAVEIKARLAALTGLPAATFATSIAVPRNFSHLLLAKEGLEIGTYDSRYTLPAGGTGGDPVADDPAMAQYAPGFLAAFHQMVRTDLKVSMERAYGAIVWKDLLASWDWKRRGVAQEQSFGVDLAIGMRRNPKLEVLVASGYYDLSTNSATAEYTVRQAKPPMERVTFRRYPSGHMLYLGDTAPAFSADVRALILRASH
ncbi:MAG: peptidase S10 [Sphingomonas sp.]